jgi:hypothetical protein
LEGTLPRPLTAEKWHSPHVRRVAAVPSVIVRLVGGMLLEQNDEWAASRARYMSLEQLAQCSDDPQARPRRIPAA